MSLLRSLTTNPRRVKQKRGQVKTELDAIRGDLEPFGYTITTNMELSSIRFANVSPELRILDIYNSSEQKMWKQIWKYFSSFVIINLLIYLYCISMKYLKVYNLMC